MWKWVKKEMFLKVVGIDNICSKLLKTVGLLAVRLNLTKLRLKNHEKWYFLTKNLIPKKNPLIKNAKMGQKINVP